MKGMDQAWLGVLAAILSGVIVLGSLLLSLVEGGQALALLPPHNATPTPPLMTLPPGAPTYTPSATPSSTPTATAEMPANCSSVPAGWQAVVIQPDDDLSTIAARYGVSVQALRQANCLPATINLVNPGSFIFVPPMPSPTPSPTPLPPTATLRPTRTTQPCGHPRGWTTYRVRPGDTLYSLSIRLGVRMQTLQVANCMGTSVKLYAGQPLWVPFIPLAPTVPPTWTPTLLPPTLTATLLAPTWTLTATSPPPTRTAPPPTSTHPAPTNTSVPTSNTPLPTNTPVPPTNTSQPTDTPVPPTNTPRPTATLQPTATSRRKATTQPPITFQAPATTQPPATKRPADTAAAPLPPGNGSFYSLAPAGGRILLEPLDWPKALFTNWTSWITFAVIK